MRRITQHLYFWVLLAILTGGVLGYAHPATAVRLKPLGDGFIALVKMLISPIIFCTVVLGIAGAGDMKKVGRVGAKALIYFEIVSTFALIIGVVIINVIRPGAGFNADPATLDANAVADYAKRARTQSTIDFVLGIIPTTFTDAFTGSGNLLQVLFVAILFGYAMTHLGKKGAVVHQFIETCSHIFFGMMNALMKLAPIGAGGAMAFTIGRYGVASLLPLAKLMAGFYATCLLFIFGVLGIVARACGFSIWRLIRYIKEEMLIVLGTSSSEPVLPRMISKLQELGCEESVTGLVIPTGYSFNLDGTCIYLVMATVFLAQATNTHLTLLQQLAIIGVLLITSKGAAGVAGAALIVLTATLSSFGTIPVASITLILGIHRFMGEAISLTNLVGNAVATIVISKWERALDMKKLNNGLRTGGGV
jgi:aerobic C4-dicarboxylate transport protein